MMQRNKNKECGHLRCGETCRLEKKPRKIYQLKRTPIKKRYYKIKVTKRPNKVSTKRKEDNKIYSAEREKFLRDHPICECGRPECKLQEATQVHHKKGRGKYFLVVSTWLAVAHECHVWIELNPVAAKELGLSESRTCKK